MGSDIKTGNLPGAGIRGGELLSECIATFIILALGDSAAAMYVLYDPSPYAQAYWGVCIAWGLAVTLAIHVTGAVSGTHANPAVTWRCRFFADFRARKYCRTRPLRVLGAFLGAAMVYLLFSPVIDHYNELHHLSRGVDGGAAGVFFTHPGLAITPLHAFVDEIVLTGILVLGVFAITEEFNTLAPAANAGALCDRSSGGDHRRVRRVPGGLAHQSGARLRAAAFLLFRRMGRASPPRASELLVGADRRPAARRHRRRRSLPGR